MDDLLPDLLYRHDALDRLRCALDEFLGMGPRELAAALRAMGREHLVILAAQARVECRPDATDDDVRRAYLDAEALTDDRLRDAIGTRIRMLDDRGWNLDNAGQPEAD